MVETVMTPVEVGAGSEGEAGLPRGKSTAYRGTAPPLAASWSLELDDDATVEGTVKEGLGGNGCCTLLCSSIGVVGWSVWVTYCRDCGILPRRRDNDEGGGDNAG